MGKHCHATVWIASKVGMLEVLRHCLKQPGFRPALSEGKARIATKRDSWGNAEYHDRACADREELDSILLHMLETRDDAIVGFRSENSALIAFDLNPYDLKPPESDKAIKILLPETPGFKRFRANGVPDANHDIDFCMEAIGNSDWFHGIEWAWVE